MNMFDRIRKLLLDDPIEGASLLHRYSFLQAKIHYLNTYNTLMLASQGKNEGINITQVNTYEGWNKTKSAGASARILKDMVSLNIFQEQNIDGEKRWIRIPVFDYSQTTANYIGLRSRGESLEGNDADYGLLLETLIEKAKDGGFNIVALGEEYDYIPDIKEIKIDSNGDPKENIKFLVNRIAFDYLHGYNIRNNNNSYYDSSELFDNEVILSAYGVLRRLGIDDEDSSIVDSASEISKDVKTSLERVKVSQEYVIKSLEIDNIIKDILTEKDALNRENQLEAFNNSVSYSKEVSGSKKEWIEFKKLSDDEFSKLIKFDQDAVCESDPEAILNSLGLRGRGKNGEIVFKGGKYWFKRDIRHEDTPSTSIGLNGGVWIWTDWGDNKKSGNIISLVSETEKISYFEATKYCMRILNLKSRLEDAQELIHLENEQLKREKWGDSKGAASKTKENINSPKKKSMKEIIKDAEERARVRRLENEEFEKKNQLNSKVVYASSKIPPLYKKMLEDRGIKTIPKNFFYIKGMIWGMNESDGSRWTQIKEGVGVLCGDETAVNMLYEEIAKNGHVEINENEEDVQIGADVHFPAYEDNYGNTRKTISFGNKNSLTYIDNGSFESKKGAIFESKMDYGAGAQTEDYQSKKIDISIANSTGNWKHVAAKAKEKGHKELIFYNQNDLPGIRFMFNILNEVRPPSFKFMKYEVGEYGEDPNDILKKGFGLSYREEIGSKETISNLISVLKEDIQKKMLQEEDIDKIQKLQEEIERLDLEYLELEKNVLDTHLDEEGQVALHFH